MIVVFFKLFLESSTLGELFLTGRQTDNNVLAVRQHCRLVPQPPSCVAVRRTKCLPPVNPLGLASYKPRHKLAHYKYYLAIITVCSGLKYVEMKIWNERVSRYMGHNPITGTV